MIEIRTEYLLANWLLVSGVPTRSRREAYQTGVRTQNLKFILKSVTIQTLVIETNLTKHNS